MKKNKFVFIVPAYNAKEWYTNNLNSITSQIYDEWRIIYIDDYSQDNTTQLVKDFALKNNIESKINIITNPSNIGPAGSRYLGYQETNDDEICCMLDGDDWLFNKYVLFKLNLIYNNGYNSTCGSYLVFTDNKLNQKIKVQPARYINVQPSLTYRKHNTWFARHLRTMRSYLIKDIPLDHIQMDGKWIKCCSDVAESYYIMEKLETKLFYIKKPTYIYNKDNSIRYELSYYRSELQEYKKNVFEYVLNKNDK